MKFISGQLVNHTQSERGFGDRLWSDTGLIPRWRYCIFATLFLAVVLLGLALWQAGYLHDFSQEGEFIHFLQAGGIKGPLICVGAEFAQVVVFAVPGTIVEFATGYVFGPWRGLAYLIVGVLVGSAFNFYFARILGRPLLQRLISRTTLDKVDTLLARMPGKVALFLLFLMPETPKDAICYGAGLTGMRPLEFVLVSSLSRLPVILATTMIASQANHHQYRNLILTCVVVLIASGGFYAYQRWRKESAKTSADDTFRAVHPENLAA